MRESQFPPVLDSPYGGFWRRFGAWCIDGLITTVAFMVLQAIWPGLMVESAVTIAMETGGGDISTFELSAVGGLVLAVIYAVYKVALESSAWQATLGKRALKIVVADLQGRRISPIIATIRSWPVWLPTALYALETLSFILAIVGLAACIAVAFTRRKQGLHDMMARCLVLRREAVFGGAEVNDEDGPWQRPG